MTDNEIEAERIIEMFLKQTHYCEINAKQCALLHVNGFLEFHEKMYIIENSIAYNYWLDIKSIIKSK